MDLCSKIAVLKKRSGFDFDADLFVGILTSLISKQQAIVTVDRDVYLNFTEQMILLVGSNIFGFTTKTVVCTPDMTTDEFAEAILLKNEHVPGGFSALPAQLGPTPVNEKTDQEWSWNGIGSRRPVSGPPGSAESLPNLVVIRDLDSSSNYVQAQLLEILRTKNLASSKGVVITPPQFLVVPLLSRNTMRRHLFPYLLDHFFLSHNYIPGNVDEAQVEFGKWTPEIELPPIASHRLFLPKEIEYLTATISSIVIGAEIRRYMHDIMVFLRMHRAIRGGISARASRDFELLVRCLCPLHGLNYATPAIVKIAARKTYTHRITVPSPEDERSMAYGSDVEAVTKFLQFWTPDLVLDDVLDSVPIPL
ncbi:hypothetical protein BZA70DRAFT_311495 [Myxozyma melibiosi]|uniref:magnesium chelatase n=1 Tax=Myxozyma melibiosi TaxID=54550 RepID=A0ABR1F3F2_9ASCO